MPQENNELQIRQLIENWAKAVRNKDLNNILAHHSEDLVMYDVPEPFQSIGIEAYKKTWDTFFNGTESGVFDIQDLTITVGEDVAFCFATMKCCNSNVNGTYEPLNFRLTIGLKKTNHQWIITHEHHSIPSK